MASANRFRSCVRSKDQPRRMSSAFRIFSSTSANLPRQVLKPISGASASRITLRSLSAIQSQSAGLLESVFRGKGHPLGKDRAEEEIAGGSLLLQATRRYGYQRQRWLPSDVPNRPAELLGRLELLFRPLGHEAQIHVTVRAGIATGVRTEKEHCPQR